MSLNRFRVAASDAPMVVRRGADYVASNGSTSAMLAALLGSGSIELSEGQFGLEAPLSLTRPGQAIIGPGLDGAVMRALVPFDGPMIANVVPPGQPWHWGLRVSGLTLVGAGIALDRGYFCRYTDLRIMDAPGSGVRLFKGGGAASDFCAYNKLENVSVSGGTGNGIIIDQGAELNELRGCNASYFQGGIPAPLYYSEPPCDAGVGLLLRGGNNTISGGHFDRCRVPIYLDFSAGNRIDTATDNALDCAAALRGARENTGTLYVGRCDPQTLASGTPGNALYGTRRAINAVNTSGNNRLTVVLRADTSPPPAGVPAQSGRGGWAWGVGESSGVGRDQDGGPNRWTLLPATTPTRLDGRGLLVS